MFFERLGGPSLPGVFPWLWHTPYCQTLRRQTENCTSFLEGIVGQHKETFDPNDIRDIIDVHLSVCIALLVGYLSFVCLLRVHNEIWKKTSTGRGVQFMTLKQVFFEREVMLEFKMW